MSHLATPCYLPADGSPSRSGCGFASCTEAGDGADSTARSRAGQELPAPGPVALRHHSLDGNLPDGVDRVADEDNTVHQVNSLLGTIG